MLCAVSISPASRSCQNRRVSADRDADAGQLRLGVLAGEVLVAPAGADRADLRVLVEDGLVDRAGVVVEPAGDRQVQRVMRLRARRTRAISPSTSFSSARPCSIVSRPGAQRIELVAARRCSEVERTCTKSRIFAATSARQAERLAGQRVAHVVGAALVQLVDLAQHQHLLLASTMPRPSK